MHKRGIKYKDTTAMPGSELYQLLTDANDTKDPVKKKELSKKAEKCHKDCSTRYNVLMGE